VKVEMKKTLLFIALAALPLLIVACASGGKKAEKVDRLSLVEDHIARITADVALLQRDNRDTAEKVQALEGRMEEILKELRTENAKLSVQLDGIDNRLQSLGERVEDSELRISNIRKELNGLRYSYSSRPYSERPADEGVRAAQPSDTTETAEQGEQQTLQPGDEASAYQTAYADYVRGEYNLALTGFRQFLHSFPAAERGADAQFYIGECLYNLGDYLTAVEAYDAVIQRHPGSQYEVSATYKKAMSFLNGNQTAQGVILLQQLIINFPDSNEARLARERLRSLGLNPQ
jgi:tol-pal system protein YbgF